MSARDDQVKSAEPFERAKLPMVIAAVAVTAGLAIAGSVDRTPARVGDPAPTVPFGGAVVLAGWVVGIGALHRLGRAGSMDRGDHRPTPTAEPKEPAEPEAAEEAEPAAADEDDDDEPKAD